MTFQLTKNTSNFLKVVSALTVMLHHYSQYVCANGISDSYIYKAFSSQGGYLGVAIFFFLSGYGLMESESKSHLNLIDFIKRRILKVYLPVLLVSGIWLLVSPVLLTQSPFTHLIEIELLGGGNTLIMSNVLIDFGDGVLWFIKALIPLYVVFYLYSIVKIYNDRLGLVFIITSTCIITVLTYYLIGPYACISVPFFTLGVLMSVFKDVRGAVVHTFGLSVVLVLLSYTMLNKSLAIHSILNILFIALLIGLLFFKKIDIKLPSIFALMTFDLYLIHNKVLMSLKGNTDSVKLWLFVSLTMIATISFYFLRTKILRLK